MTEPHLCYEIKGQAAWITINREERRNALSLEMMDLFMDYLDKAESDDAVRVVCLTAAGEKAFCSGADLASSFAGGGHMTGPTKYAGLLKRMADFPKPLVARINGHCVAGGMGLILSCDIVYARDGVQFGTPEVKVGLFPMMIGALVFRNAGRKKALEMIYTARMISAVEAEQMGLITRALPAEKLDPVVNEALSDIAAKAPLAVEMGRKALAEAEDMPLSQALDLLCKRLVDVASTEDAVEGLTAFMQKRQPVWKRR